LITLFPDGFEEREHDGALELAAYTDEHGERRLRGAFRDAEVERVEPGWEDRWRRFHRAVTIGELWVGPPWLRPPADAVAVVIDPGRAFGTGAHPTTRLCLELVHELPRGSALDVGCGSGVLAIAAAKLGFRPVRAVDSDPIAVEAARRNANTNRADVEVAVADALSDSLPTADVVLANISLAAIEALAPRVDCAVLVTSGYLAGERPAVAGFEAVARRERDGWAAEIFAPR
jgi:ribosomal protein L11 methyltransferase